MEEEEEEDGEKGEKGEGGRGRRVWAQVRIDASTLRLLLSEASFVDSGLLVFHC